MTINFCHKLNENKFKKKKFLKSSLPPFQYLFYSNKICFGGYIYKVIKSESSK